MSRSGVTCGCLDDDDVLACICSSPISLHELDFFVTCREIDQLLEALEPGFLFLCAGHPSRGQAAIVGREILKVVPSDGLFLEPCLEFLWQPCGHWRSLDAMGGARRGETGSRPFSPGGPPVHTAGGALR